MTNNKHYFYTSVWAKYVPIIRILIKKSGAADQELQFNKIDFERAGYTRKSGYKFTVNMINNKSDIIFTSNELIQTFISVLQGDPVILEHLLKDSYTFNFSGKFLLRISNTTKVAESKQTDVAPS